jgi:hypothetical protein
VGKEDTQVALLDVATFLVEQKGGLSLRADADATEDGVEEVVVGRRKGGIVDFEELRDGRLGRCGGCGERSVYFVHECMYAKFSAKLISFLMIYHTICI